MGTDRLAAFSDGVIAVIITIMVLELRTPDGTSWRALLADAPIFASYVLSFVMVAIYWNNHHHLLHLIRRVDGLVMWTNLHLLFWLSLIPLATSWIGRNHDATAPTALFGIVLLASALAWMLLQMAMRRVEGEDRAVSRAVGRDRKGAASGLLYVAGIALSVFVPLASYALYVVVALMWLVPDRRVTRVHLNM